MSPIVFGKIDHNENLSLREKDKKEKNGVNISYFCINTIEQSALLRSDIMKKQLIFREVVETQGFCENKLRFHIHYKMKMDYNIILKSFEKSNLKNYCPEQG